MGRGFGPAGSSVLAGRTPRAAPRLPHGGPEGVRAPERTHGSQAPDHRLLSLWLESCAGLRIALGELPAKAAGTRTGPELRGRARGAASPAGRDPRPERSGCPFLKAMQTRVGARESSLIPARVPHRSVWSTETKAWGKRLRQAEGTSGPESDRVAVAEARPRGPRGYLRKGSGEPGAHAPSLADPSARLDAWRRRARGSATSVLTGSDGIMRHRWTSRCPPGAQGVLTQVPAAPAAPLPCKPRRRGIRFLSAALDLLPGPVPLAFVARQQSEGFR